MSVPMRVFTDGNLVFKWGPSANDDRVYDSHISIYTKRHLDNCAANGSLPWPLQEIRIMAKNAETGRYQYIIGNTEGDFARFCDGWGDDPRAVRLWAHAQIAELEKKNSSPFIRNLTPAPRN